jgi:hypothetical protein
VAEHENLEFLGSIAATEEHDQLEQTADSDVQARHKQRRPPTDGVADATGASEARLRYPIEYLHPTGEPTGGIRA